MTINTFNFQLYKLYNFMNFQLSLFFLFFSSLLLAQSPSNNSLPFFNGKNYQSASISYVVFDLQKKQKVISYREDKSMIPASVQKLFTTATALESFGANYQIKTNIYYTGNIQNHVLYGDLIIQGNGDPTCASKYFYDTKSPYQFTDSVLKIVQQKGIRKITGKIIADGSQFSDEALSPTWSWEDIANYYACGTYAFPIKDNLYKIHFYSPQLPEQDTRINYLEPAIPKIKITNRIKSSNKNKDLAYAFSKPFDNDIILRGSIPKNRKDFVVKGAIPDPNFFYVYVLDSILRKNGINIIKKPLVSAKTVQEKTLLGNYKSVKLAEIIYFTNKKSINNFADQLAANLCLLNGEKASLRMATPIILKHWKDKGMNTDGMFLSDGSGLSRHNTLTVNQLVFLLKTMKNSVDSKVFYQSLPINGKDGTLKYFGKNKIKAGKIHAKTGSFRQVRSMTGYIKTNSGKTYAFAIIINNYEGKSREIKSDMENFCSHIIKNF